MASRVSLRRLGSAAASVTRSPAVALGAAAASAGLFVVILSLARRLAALHPVGSVPDFLFGFTQQARACTPVAAAAGAAAAAAAPVRRRLCPAAAAAAGISAGLRLTPETRISRSC
jgi:hypothetical protein